MGDCVSAEFMDCPLKFCCFVTDPKLSVFCRSLLRKCTLSPQIRKKIVKHIFFLNEMPTCGVVQDAACGFKHVTVWWFNRWHSRLSWASACTLSSPAGGVPAPVLAGETPRNPWWGTTGALQAHLLVYDSHWRRGIVKMDISVGPSPCDAPLGTWVSKMEWEAVPWEFQRWTATSLKVVPGTDAPLQESNPARCLLINSLPVDQQLEPLLWRFVPPLRGCCVHLQGSNWAWGIKVVLRAQY